MPDREIKAKEVIKDIHSGMDNASLMKKYKLTQEGLQNLFDELGALGLLETHDEEESSPPKIRINIKDFLRDFRDGMSDSGLMDRYCVSRRALDFVFKRLLELKAIKPDELFGEPSLASYSITPANVRELGRYRLDFELAVIQAGAPGVTGMVRDITESGVGVIGIPAVPGDILTLEIQPEEFLEVSPFRFACECRWNKLERETQSYSAGFKIIDISDENLGHLRELLHLLTLSD
jgi:hypothetical protein